MRPIKLREWPTESMSVSPLRLGVGTESQFSPALHSISRRVLYLYFLFFIALLASETKQVGNKGERGEVEGEGRAQGNELVPVPDGTSKESSCACRLRGADAPVARSEPPRPLSVGLDWVWQGKDQSEWFICFRLAARFSFFRGRRFCIFVFSC